MTSKTKPPPSRRRLIFGGAKGIRTPDLNTASVALFQLSYGPFSGGGEGIRTPDLDSAIVALFQLSYTPAPSRRVILPRIERNVKPETGKSTYIMVLDCAIILTDRSVGEMKDTSCEEDFSYE